MPSRGALRADFELNDLARSGTQRMSAAWQSDAYVVGPASRAGRGRPLVSLPPARARNGFQGYSQFLVPLGSRDLQRLRITQRRLGLRPSEVVAADLAVEGRAFDAEDFGRAALVPAGVFQRGVDVAAFDSASGSGS